MAIDAPKSFWQSNRKRLSLATAAAENRNFLKLREARQQTQDLGACLNSTADDCGLVTCARRKETRPQGRDRPGPHGADERAVHDRDGQTGDWRVQDYYGAGPRQPGRTVCRVTSDPLDSCGRIRALDGGAQPVEASRLFAPGIVSVAQHHLERLNAFPGLEQAQGIGDDPYGSRHIKDIGPKHCCLVEIEEFCCRGHCRICQRASRNGRIARFHNFRIARRASSRTIKRAGKSRRAPATRFRERP